MRFTARQLVLLSLALAEYVLKLRRAAGQAWGQDTSTEALCNNATAKQNQLLHALSPNRLVSIRD